MSCLKPLKRCNTTTSLKGPSLESNLLYGTAQQTNPWRAGTPGRAPRNRQAVVVNRRPLSLFIGLFFCATFVASAHAQQHPSIQFRLGAFYATPLVKDAVSSAALDQAIPGQRSHNVNVREGIGPIGTVAVRLPLRGTMHLELSGSAAQTKIRGDDGLQTWDVANATVGDLVFSVGGWYRGTIAWRGGIGATRLFTAQRGVFSKGNGIRPLLEAGIGAQLAKRFELSARVQTHSFGTTTLRDNGGSDGNVLRGIIQVGTTLWQGK
jgi:hypothetical protein